MNDLNLRLAALIALGARLIVALFQNTIMSADEVYQAAEVAHRIVFGYGMLTWEWFPAARIRGFMHPLIFIIPFQIASFLGVDTPYLISILPRLVQACLAAIGDVCLFVLAKRCLYGEGPLLAFILQFGSMWSINVQSRTFSNSAETVFTTAALIFWPTFQVPQSASADVSKMNSTQMHKLIASLGLAILSCAIRPTAAITWIFLGVHLILQQGSIRSVIKLMLFYVIPIGSLGIGMMLMIDRYFYGFWTVAPVNFVLINSVNKFAALYGTNAFHWYFTAGLFHILTTLLPFSLWGAVTAWKEGFRLPSMLFLWVCFVLSFTTHKEARFLSPVFPVCILLAAVGIQSTILKQNVVSKPMVTKHNHADATTITSSATNNSTDRLCNGQSQVRRRHKTQPTEVTERLNANVTIQLPKNNSTSRFAILAIFIFLTQTVPGLYFALNHQCGSVHAIQFVRQEAAHFRANPGILPSDVDFSVHDSDFKLQQLSIDSYSKSSKAKHVPMRVHIWSSCHSTPLYSHVHEPIELVQLDCSPYARNSVHGALDTQFLKNPTKFLEEKWYNGIVAPPPLPVLSQTPMISNHSQFVSASIADIPPDAEPMKNSDQLPKHLPSHVIVPDSIVPYVSSFLCKHKFVLAKSFGHAYFQTDNDSLYMMRRYYVYRHAWWQQWAELAAV